MKALDHPWVLRPWWYRNAGRGLYHLARPDWVRSGKAVCGARIGRPAVTTDDPAKDNRRACKHCTRKATDNG